MIKIRSNYYYINNLKILKIVSFKLLIRYFFTLKSNTCNSRLLYLSYFFILPLFLFNFSGFAQKNNKLKTIIVDAGHGGHDSGATGDYENSLNSQEKDITLAISLKLVDALKEKFPDLKVIPTRTTDVYQSVTEKANIANENNGDLFICIHADYGPTKSGRRQVGTHTVKNYHVSYLGKGKITTPYYVEEPIYDYFKMPLGRNGTSVWIFAAHKTSDKLKAIMSESGQSESEYQVEAIADSSFSKINFSTPEGKVIAQVYAKRYQEKSELLARLVNVEIEKTSRPALGVNQRQVGIWVLQATKMPSILIETGFINNQEDEIYLNSENGQLEIVNSITQAVLRYKEHIENN